MQCDSKSAYNYNFRINCKKQETANCGILVKRVVTASMSTLRKPNVKLRFDLCFTREHLF